MPIDMTTTYKHSLEALDTLLSSYTKEQFRKEMQKYENDDFNKNTNMIENTKKII